MKKRIGVVGSGCVDIYAASAQPIVARDSNPGAVTIGFGGVGRNIAENLARLGQEVLLIAAFGSEPLSAQMREYTDGAGVNTEHSLIDPEGKAPYYISLNDSGGDMYAAVNDMQICDRITPEFLSGKLALLNQCDAVVLDANIPGESVAYLAQRCVPPLFADAVSTAKAARLYPALPRLFAIHANLREAEALLHVSVFGDISSLKSAADRFHGMGISCVFITLGSSGAFLSYGGEQFSAKAYPVKAVNLNGCGDAFSAAAFLGVILRDTPDAILRNALAAAAITARSAKAVSEGMSLPAIRALLNELR